MPRVARVARICRSERLVLPLHPPPSATWSEAAPAERHTEADRPPQLRPVTWKPRHATSTSLHTAPPTRPPRRPVLIPAFYLLLGSEPAEAAPRPRRW